MGELNALDKANTQAVHGHTGRLEVVYVSHSEWADYHNSGYIDDDGRSLDPKSNKHLKIDDTMQRWSVHSTPATPLRSPKPPEEAKPSNDDWA
jgi:hypothetical protein